MIYRIAPTLPDRFASNLSIYRQSTTINGNSLLRSSVVRIGSNAATKQGIDNADTGRSWGYVLLIQSAEKGSYQKITSAREPRRGEDRAKLPISGSKTCNADQNRPWPPLLFKDLHAFRSLSHTNFANGAQSKICHIRPVIVRMVAHLLSVVPCYGRLRGTRITFQLIGKIALTFV